MKSGVYLNLIIVAGVIATSALTITVRTVQGTSDRGAISQAPSSPLPTTQADPRVYRPKNKPPAAPATESAIIIHRVATTEPVIFITIDDGVTPDIAGLELMRQRGAAATLFLNNANIHRHYDYFKEWQKNGSTIQNHTDLHPDLTKIDTARQKIEICNHADRLQQVFGTKPTLFRPPYGAINDSHLGLIGSCGHKYVVQWSATVNNGQIRYASGHMQAGEIVLLHFTPDLAKDLAAVFAAADAQRLQIGRLEDWLF